MLTTASVSVSVDSGCVERPIMLDLGAFHGWNATCRAKRYAWFAGKGATMIYHDFLGYNGEAYFDESDWVGFIWYGDDFASSFGASFPLLNILVSSIVLDGEKMAAFNFSQAGEPFYTWDMVSDLSYEAPAKTKFGKKAIGANEGYIMGRDGAHFITSNLHRWRMIIQGPGPGGGYNIWAGDKETWSRFKDFFDSQPDEIRIYEMDDRRVEYKDSFKFDCKPDVPEVVRAALGPVKLVGEIGLEPRTAVSGALWHGESNS
jgi:hypothetical protein